MIGFVPVIGLLPAIYAILCWMRVRRAYGNQWNPASAYLEFGAVAGLFGLLSSALLALAVGLSLINQSIF